MTLRGIRRNCGRVDRGMAWREGMVWEVDELAARSRNGVLGMAWFEGMVWGAETLFSAVLELQCVPAR